jgi:GTP-binding protein
VKPSTSTSIDTPGHADFGGEVERVLKMADGVLLLVDAAEGPMPQTRYVLSKALALHLRLIVVVNKMRPARGPPREGGQRGVRSARGELACRATSALDFPVIYASGREGWAATEPDQLAGRDDITSVRSMPIIEHVPVPDLGYADVPLQVLITTPGLFIEYVGRIAIGRVFAGAISSGKAVTLCVIDRKGNRSIQRIGQLFQFDKLGRREVDRIDVGDLCAVVGLEKVDIGDTLADPENPIALPTVAVDEPTLHMTFRINDGAFSGREGKYVTNRQLRERLQRELQSNVALRVDDRGDEFVVSGRGLLHLGILLENMRREGYELCVGKPEVIYHRDENGKRTEPIERLVVDVPTGSVGAAMQLLGDRKAEMVHMDTRGNRSSIEFLAPSRGLIGLRSRLLTATAGEAIMHHRFESYGPFRGEIPHRTNGAMIATESGSVTAYALDQLAGRGIMFVKPGDPVYEGQVVGEHCKDSDIPVNIIRAKKLTNMRMSTKEATVTLKAPKQFTLESALEYIEADELVELTPESIRLRKRLLKENDRKRADRQRG